MPRLGVFVILVVCALECTVGFRLLRAQRRLYDEPLFRTSYREPSVYLGRSTFGLGRSSTFFRPERIQSGRILNLGFSELPSAHHRTSLHSHYNEHNRQLTRTSSREVLGNPLRTPEHHQSTLLLSGLRRVQEPRANVASVSDTLRHRQTIPSSREVLGHSVLGHSQRVLQPNHSERQMTRLLQVQEPRKVIAKISISRQAASGKTSKEVIGQPAQWERQAVPVFEEKPAQPADMGKIIDLIQEQRKQQHKVLEQKQKHLQKQQELVHKSLQKQQEELQKMLKTKLEQQQKQQQQQVKLTSKEVFGLW